MEYSSEQNKICSCKGIRTCAVCEKIKNIESNILPMINLNILINHLIIDSNTNVTITHFNLNESDSQDLNKYIYSEKEKLNKTNEYIFSGFFKITGLFKNSECSFLIDELNKTEWIPSQSGRKKQDYGPKINYKKRKIKPSNEPFPEYKQFIQNKLNSIELLKDFNIDEIGNLYYEAALGSHIDPHIDHHWIWGDRIIGINLLAQTILTFSIEYDNKLYEIDFEVGVGDVYIMSEEARYIWKHSVKKENLKNDRIVITLREYIK
jgi:alkylated DNA repair protein alkB family protein 4